MSLDLKQYMQLCLDLAKKALGQTSPNPYVGAVIVKNGKIIGQGYHRKSGEDHAEVDALKNANESVKGATLYCNLEPCCHTNKKTAPCAQRIIQEGFSKVVIANLDPNPQVAGQGVQLLRDAGLEVITGILEEEGKLLNEVFFFHIQTKTPFVHLKWAQTLDGKIATLNYHSKWITGDAARVHVHRERRLYDGILIGAHTLKRDNPRLTTRLGEVTCSKRIILSASGDIDFNHTVFTDEFKHNTILITSEQNKIDAPVQVLYAKAKNGLFDLKAVLELLYGHGIYSIFVEGGPTVINRFIEQNLYQRLSIYMAPKILGDGVHSVSGLQFDHIHESIQFDAGHWQKFEKDMLFESEKNICLQD